MGDAYGRKTMLLWALGLFVAGSALCAIAPTLVILIFARALQGFGGGGLMTLAQALLGEVVSPKERGRFQGWFGTVFALASTLGPVIGGVLSQHLGWRSVFWINIPLGLGAAVAAFRAKTTPGTGICRLDYAGTSVLMASTVALLLALSMGGHEISWTSPALLALTVLGIGGFAVLLKVEQKSQDPLISPQLIEEPVIWRASLTVLLFAAVLFGLIVQLPIFFQTARIAQDRANKIVILTGAGGEFITDVDWSSFGDVADPGVWSQVHDEGVQVLENIANIRVPVIAAIEGRAHVHSDYALLASVIVAADGATFQDVAHFAVGVAPGDGIFTTWSYRAGAGRTEAFLLNPQPLAARKAHEWGVVAEVVPNGKAVSRARELADLYLKVPEVTRRNTRVHFIQPLKERIVHEVGYGLSLEGASSADLVKSMHVKSEPVAQKKKQSA